ncbi:MAG: AMP-binding protein, partial [Verrucomicrobia bacterium]
GTALADAVAREWGVPVVNLYGPTETTIQVAHWVHESGGCAGATVPIGRPLANARLYVLDSRGGLAPIGVAGELHVGGEVVARGYLGKPALTAEKFLPDPMGVAAGARMYRTGDRVRWRADGTLEFLGRVDRQVKLRGFRIELGEIEAVLGGHPGLAQSVVLLREDRPGEARLVAYGVAARAAAAPSAGELRRHLRAGLPEHMVPSAFVFLDALPTTPNGKVDRKALPAPEADRPGTESVQGTPGTLTEALMTDLWCRVLGMARVGPDDNFFDLGGHSLLSMRLMDQIRQVFAVDLSPRVLFTEPTVRTLARRVQDAVWRPGSVATGGSGDSWTALQASGDRPPIFVFPGGYGDDSEIISQAWMSRRHLGPDQPVHALGSAGLDGSVDGQRTLRAAARDALAGMRRIRPRGPWFLVGLCVGGNLAFEVACQAQRAGETVGMLALADCLVPRRWEYARFCAADPLRGNRQFLMNTLFLSLPSVPATPADRWERHVAGRKRPGVACLPSLRGNPAPPDDAAARKVPGPHRSGGERGIPESGSHPRMARARHRGGGSAGNAGEPFDLPGSGGRAVGVLVSAPDGIGDPGQWT